MNIVREKILTPVTPVSNQLGFPTCTPSAICDACEYVAGDGVNLSRLFVFWNSTKGSSGGASMSSALDVSKNMGVPPEDLWPYSKKNLDVKPSDEAYKEAPLRKGNFSLVLSKAEMISSIDAGNPVVIGMTCPQIFNTPGSQPKDHIFVASDPVDETFLHAMIIVGYRIFEDGSCHFRARNSWGNNWMDQGYCWFESDYIINNASSSWRVLPTHPGESLLSKRNFEFIFGIVSLFILEIFRIIHGPLVYFLITPIIILLLCWRRFYVNNSVLDEAHLFKLLSSYRNSIGSPIRLFREVINSSLR